MSVLSRVWGAFCELVAWIASFWGVGSGEWGLGALRAGFGNCERFGMGRNFAVFSLGCAPETEAVRVRLNIWAVSLSLWRIFGACPIFSVHQNDGR